MICTVERLLRDSFLGILKSMAGDADPGVSKAPVIHGHLDQLERSEKAQIQIAGP
jgi:hypothetical protein